MAFPLPSPYVKDPEIQRNFVAIAEELATTTTSSGVSALDRATTTIDVVNTTTETTIYTYSIPAGTLSTNKAVRLTLFGDYLNDSGANKTFTLKVKYGATTLFDDVTVVITDNAARRELGLEILLANQGASDQILHGMLSLSAVTAATSGRGDLAAADLINRSFGGDSAEDSTAAKTFLVTVTHSAAASTVSLRFQYATLEIV